MTNPTQYVAIKFGASGWVDVTADAGNITINKGTTRVAEDYQAGSLSVTFTNNNRRFDPLNTSSNLYYSAGGYSLVQPGAQVLVTSNSVQIFLGYVQDWSFTFGEAGLDGNATLTAGDFLSYVSRINFDSSQETSAKFTHDRLADVLTKYNLTTSGVTVKNSSTLIGADTHNTGDNVLSYLQNVARSEPGDLFADNYGMLIFKDRTFTNYLWTTSYRNNVVQYPSAATTAVWQSTYSASTATPYFAGGTAINSKVDSPNTFHAVSYFELNKPLYNPAGTALNYVFSCWVRGNGGTVGIDAYVDLYDAQRNPVTTPLIFTPFVSGTAGSNTTWINLKGTVSATGAQPVAGIGFTVSCGGTTNAYSFIADGFQVELASTYENDYFNGSLNPKTNSAKTQYQVAWLGQAYSSSSVLAKKNNAINPSAQTYITFADVNSQGTAYGNGTAIQFTEIDLASSGLNLYNQVQVSATNATATVTDTAGTALYGLKTFSQTDNLTTSVTRPAEIAQDFLGVWRLPEYRANSFTVALESLTSTQQNIVLGLELRDVIRLCFQPSATGQVVDKLYQILSINTQADVERHHISFQVASLSNVPIRLNSEYVAQLNSSILG